MIGLKKDIDVHFVFFSFSEQRKIPLEKYTDIYVLSINSRVRGLTGKKFNIQALHNVLRHGDTSQANIGTNVCIFDDSFIYMKIDMYMFTYVFSFKMH